MPKYEYSEFQKPGYPYTQNSENLDISMFEHREFRKYECTEVVVVILAAVDGNNKRNFFV